MDENIQKWIWQHEKYPNFPYKKDALTELLSKIEYNRGLLDGISKTFAKEELRELEINALIEEAVHTSLIEGEYFKRESVRSSVRKKLDNLFFF